MAIRLARETECPSSFFILRAALKNQDHLDKHTARVYFAYAALVDHFPDGGDTYHDCWVEFMDVAFTFTDGLVGECADDGHLRSLSTSIEEEQEVDCEG